MQDIYTTFEFNKIQESIKEYSKTELGKEKIDNLSILSSYEEVENALLDLQEMMSIVNRFGVMPIATSANALYLIDLAKKTALLTPRDLNLIADDVLTSQAIIRFLNKVDVSYPRIKAKAENFVDLANLEKEIHRVITSSLTVDDKATPELKEIRSKLKKLESTLQQKIITLAFTYSKYLNDDNATIRDGHFVLPVKTADKSKVMGIIYDVSDSGNTTFIEPLEIVQANNEITSLKVQENEEVRKILKALTNLVLLQEKEIIKNNAIIAEFDFLIAKSLYANQINADIATLSKEQIIDLVDARHPLINPHKVVANSYHLDSEKRIVIISGPNAGGKTVSLKTVGLLILMNQCGLAVPANKATLGYFKNIFIDIGDNQSLSDNLSTFSAHMSQIGEITQIVKGKDLVLIDELGTGTDPKEGEALAFAVVKYLENKNALAIISSHFSSLKEYAFLSQHIENSSMVFDEENLLPTYKFRQGTPGQSYALDVAGRYGISSDIVKEAKKYLKNNKTNDASELLNILQKKLDRASKLEDELHRKEKEIELTQKKLANDEELLKTRRDNLLKDVKEEKAEMIEKAQKEVDEIISKLSNEGNKLHEVIDLKRQLNELKDRADTITYNEEIVEGDFVSIPSLNLSGKVISLKGKKATISTNDGFSFSIDAEKLHKIEAPRVNKPKKVSSSYSYDSIINTNVGLELNLIGMHVEEAQNALEKYLDNVRLKHLKQVRIIHGFGSGALRKMVRDYLSKQKDCTYRSGDMHEGGGGATVVIFK